MSQSTKRKHVTKEVLDDFELPKDNQKIVRIVAGRGNNLHQVIEADETTSYLVSMPTKFRKNVWIKRGDYCIVESIDEGDKVKAEIVRILYKDQIRNIKSEKLWPFQDKSAEETNKKTDFDLPPNSSDSEEDLIQNPNRMQAKEDSSDEEKTSEEDSD